MKNNEYLKFGIVVNLALILLNKNKNRIIYQDLLIAGVKKAQEINTHVFIVIKGEERNKDLDYAIISCFLIKYHNIV